MFSKSAEYERIMALIPGTDPEMLDRFLGGQQISPTTARIWAEQGALGVFAGDLRKLPPPPVDFVSPHPRLNCSLLRVRYVLELF